MFNFLSRDHAYTWISALFVVLVVSSGFFINFEISPSTSNTALTPRSELSVSVRDSTHNQIQDRRAETPSSNQSSLARREDYSCGPGRPCANGACCGTSGFCGYGPASCGTGCISNCNAHAECGEFSSPANKKCPLNTCCSKHGFCGTTKDYCTDGCQSNCILSPQPPGSKKGQALKKIIGYYESWSYRSTCNHKKPTDLPLNELTHLNYAFAFISPSSYELVVMDSKTDEALFKEVTGAKDYNGDLKVFISVGGWTFSDNGTVTQPLLSEISSSESNRQKFADNVVKFCNKWGFDGLDIDWEYPGAPDRGGKPEDTENFTKLMKSLRQAFNGSPRVLELSFTIPSSYWYLKWFDLPGLLEYADWTNLMSYDLHGIWDRNNPIGNIVQGHTNLTEIKLAAELLWRVGVKPEQVALGYGFYGRAFELQDAGCSTPGCAFKGGAREGPCSKESGILMYYELKAILDQAPNLKPVWDKEAAVKYLVFDNNQWISYDDKDTFKQKIEWANSVGFSGALIWASDTDDDKFTAMSGFLDKPVGHITVESTALEANSVNIAQTHNALSGKECSLYKDGGCRSQKDLDNHSVRCPNGNPPIGWDKDGCKEGGKPICCSGNIYPSKCTWRGSGGDCNGQCHAGEQKIHGSSWGGGYEAESSTKKCSRGGKAFCCEASDWKNVVEGCYWTSCGGDCKSTEDAKLRSDNCNHNIISASKYYCCPKGNVLYGCQWRGSSPDCPGSNCEKDEVTVLTDPIGDHTFYCSWGRQLAGCCHVGNPPPKPLDCTKTTCEIDPSWCNEDVDEYGVPVEADSSSSSSSLQARDGKGQKWRTFGGQVLTTIILSYIDRTQYMRQLRANLRGLSNTYFRLQGSRCGQRALRALRIGTEAPERTQIEHAVPLLLLSRFWASAGFGRYWTNAVMRARSNPVPAGEETPTGRVSNEFFVEHLNDPEALPADVERLTENSPRYRMPAQLIAEAFGSTTNAANFLFLESAVNQAKGRIESFAHNIGPRRLNPLITEATRGDEAAAEQMLEALAEARAVFTYLNNDIVMTRVDNTVNNIRRALQIIERHIPSAEGLVTHWDTFYPYYMAQASDLARTRQASQIQDIRRRLGVNTSPFVARVLAELTELENDIPKMRYPFEDPPKK